MTSKPDNVKRYDLEDTSRGYEARLQMVLRDDGDWVSSHDYDDLRKRVGELEAAVRTEEASTLLGTSIGLSTAEVQKMALESFASVNVELEAERDEANARADKAEKERDQAEALVRTWMAEFRIQSQADEVGATARGSNGVLSSNERQMMKTWKSDRRAMEMLREELRDRLENDHPCDAVSLVLVDTKDRAGGEWEFSRDGRSVRATDPADAIVKGLWDTKS